MIFPKFKYDQPVFCQISQQYQCKYDKNDKKVTVEYK